MIDELLDRFGEPPKSVMNLLMIALLKAKAHQAYITDITSKGKNIRLTMYSKAEIMTEKIPEMVAGMGRRLRFVPGATPYFVYEPEGNLLEQAEMITEKIHGLCVTKGGENEK